MTRAAEIAALAARGLAEVMDGRGEPATFLQVAVQTYSTATSRPGDPTPPVSIAITCAVSGWKTRRTSTGFQRFKTATIPLAQLAGVTSITNRDKLQFSAKDWNIIEVRSSPVAWVLDIAGT